MTTGVNAKQGNLSDREASGETERHDVLGCAMCCSPGEVFSQNVQNPKNLFKAASQIMHILFYIHTIALIADVALTAITF